jgi:tight adherence protein B
MTIALIMIALGLLLAGAGALAGVAAALRTEQQIARRRVDIILSTPGGPAEGHGVRRVRLIGMVRAVLGVGVRQSWESKTSTGLLLVTSLVAGAVAWLGFFGVFHAPAWIWIPGTLLAMMIPPQALLRLEQRRLEAKFVDMFPDAIDMIVRMLRAGLPMTSAIGVVGTEAASPVREVFAAVSDQMAIGANFDRALIAAGKRVRPEAFRFFTVAASLQQATGGNLAATLEILSEIIRKRRAGRMKAKAVTAEVRMSSLVLAAIPFVVIAGLMVINPAYLQPLISDRRGNIIVALALGLLFIGFYTMGQMMRSATRM